MIAKEQEKPKWSKKRLDELFRRVKWFRNADKKTTYKQAVIEALKYYGEYSSDNERLLMDEVRRRPAGERKALLEYLKVRAEHRVAR